jgi:hypothetical protein
LYSSRRLNHGPVSLRPFASRVGCQNQVHTFLITPISRLNPSFGTPQADRLYGRAVRLTPWTELTHPTRECGSEGVHVGVQAGARGDALDDPPDHSSTAEGRTNNSVAIAIEKTL